MKAVEILHNVEKYFDRNHDVFLRFGGLFVLIFFTLYVPYSMIHSTRSELGSMLEHERAINLVLTTELHTANEKAEFFELSFERKKILMQEVECLARNIYFEAGNQPHAGKLAVAQVTINRVNSEHFPKSVCGVVYQRTNHTCQFSWVCENKGNPRHNPTWKESLLIAEKFIINKERFQMIGNAKFFHATYVQPPWSEQKKVVAQIGQHIFYR